MFTYNIYAIVAIVSLCGVVLGAETLSSVLWTSEDFFRSYGVSFTSAQFFWVASTGAGAFVGCLLCGLCSFFGCTKLFLLMEALWFCGSAMVCLSRNVVLMIVGKAIRGVSLGFISALVPMYLSEMVPKKRIGLAVALVQLASSLGALAIIIMTFFSSHSISSETAFKLSWAIGSVPALIMLPLIFILPESPKWLAIHSNWEQAAQNLRNIKQYYQKLPENEQYHSDMSKLFVIKSLFTDSDSMNCSYAKLFDTKHRNTTLCAMASQVIVQLTASTTIIIFCGYICSAYGLQDNTIMLVYCLDIIIMVTFTVFPVFLLDNCRRKDVVVFGMVMTGVLYFAIYGTLAMDFTDSEWALRNKSVSLAMALVLIITGLVAAMVSPLGWLYVAEMHPGFSGTKGLSISMSLYWVTHMGMTFAVPAGLKALRYWVFLILGIICIVGGIAFAFFPEASDLSDMDLKRSNTKTTNCNVDNRNPKEIEVKQLPKYVMSHEGSSSTKSYNRKSSISEFKLGQTEISTSTSHETTKVPTYLS